MRTVECESEPGALSWNPILQSWRMQGLRVLALQIRWNLFPFCFCVCWILPLDLAKVYLSHSIGTSHTMIHPPFLFSFFLHLLASSFPVTTHVTLYMGGPHLSTSDFWSCSSVYSGYSVIFGSLLFFGSLTHPFTELHSYITLHMFMFMNMAFKTTRCPQLYCFYWICVLWPPHSFSLCVTNK